MTTNTPAYVPFLQRDRSGLRRGLNPSGQVQPSYSDTVTSFNFVVPFTGGFVFGVITGILWAGVSK